MIGPALVIALGLAFADATAPGPANPSTPTRRPRATAEPGRWGWLADPRSAVLLTLGAAAVLGGGRKLMLAMRARKARARLVEPDVTAEEIAEAARFGRDGLMDLFRLMETAPDAERREAAGHALAGLWKRDELVAEEEKAIVRRGFSATWHARRRYPRDLAAAIPIRVEYGVPFSRDVEGEVGPDELAWSHSIVGAERASLEEASPWATGPGVAPFAIDPADFPGNGPHRLVLQARARTLDYVEPPAADFAPPSKAPRSDAPPSGWVLDLPHVRFTLEFDPQLRVDALLAPDDEARAGLIREGVALRSHPASDDRPRFVALTDDLVLRDPPSLVVMRPLPADLAHAVFVEFEGIPGRFAAGEAVVVGQGSGSRTIPLAPRSPLPPGSIERPGEVRLRAILEADPHRGWADPDVRSIWPGAIVTDWATARVVRR